MPTACASPPTAGSPSARSPTSRASSPGSTTASPRRSTRCGCASGAAAATLTAPATVTVRGGAVELTPLGARLRHRQPDRAGPHGRGLRPRPRHPRPAARRSPTPCAPTSASPGASTAPPASPARATRRTCASTSRAAGVAAAATRAAGLPPLALTATGATAGRPAEPRRPRRRRERAGGAGAGLGAARRRRRSTSASTCRPSRCCSIDRAAGNQGLRGTVTGQGRVDRHRSPTPRPPSSCAAPGISARVLRENGVPPLGLAAAGELPRRRRHPALGQRHRRRRHGPDRLRPRPAGRPRASTCGVAGTLPLAMADPLLEERSAQVGGQLRVNATVRGSLAAPRFGGTVALRGRHAGRSRRPTSA